MKERRDVWMWLGIAVVAAAAAVMSFDALRRLAARTGVVPELAWLFPLAVDAAIVVATCAWLSGDRTPRVVSYARSLALGSLTLSVAGNAAEHGMHAYAITTPWWVVVAVSAVPPAMLGAIAHLAALTLADRRSVTVGTAPVAAPVAPSPAGVPTPTVARRDVTRIPAGGKAAIMRATFERYRDEGRLDQLTGAELARAADATPSLGRRYLAQWRAETETATDTDEQAA